MIQNFRVSLSMLLTLTILTGVIYPCLVTAVAQIVFPFRANGSMIRSGESLVGSELIGQPFAARKYFWGRLSATGPMTYNAAASSGSNLGPMNPDLLSSIQARIEALRDSGVEDSMLPVDLVTASASGLDPHISPAAANVQIERVAAARNLDETQVRTVVASHTQARQFGIFGEPRVNVLQLNLALDSLLER